jgi:hypothetical protein
LRNRAIQQGRRDDAWLHEVAYGWPDLSLLAAY